MSLTNKLCVLSLLLLIFSVEANYNPYCVSVSGKSPGAINFCENCQEKNSLGIGVYWTGALGNFLTYSILGEKIWNNSDFTLDTTTFVEIEVTSIEIDGRPLLGWFHFRINLADHRPFYSYIIQVEDDENRRTIGQFTTELGGMCESRGELKMTPTQSQVLPCQATFRDQTTHANSVAYYREASLKDNIVRAKDANEIHLNWKIPPGYACSHSKRFSIRAELFSAPKGDPRTCIAPHCPAEPDIHIHVRHKIHLPALEIAKQFHRADPLPLFIQPNTVNCQVPILTKTNPTDPTDLFPDTYIQKIDIKTDCANDPFFAAGRTGAFCRQGTIIGVLDNSVRSCVHVSHCPRQQSGSFESKCFGTIAERPVKTFMVPRELYLGRCLAELAGIHAHPTYPLKCKSINFNNGQNSDYLPDIKYIETLETPFKYIEHIRYDTCNCYSDIRGGGDASLRRRLASTLPPKVQPPADYPVVEETNPGKQTLVASSFSESGVNQSAKNSPNYPTKIVSKYARRAHITHGALITLAFMFFLPVGIFIARFLKESTHNMTVMTYDFWYQAHVFMILAAFFCAVCGSYLTGAMTYWRTEGVSTTVHPHLHKNIGWVTVAIFMVTLICGPFRSLLCIKVSVIIHSVAGDISYYFGLLTLLLYLVGFEDDEHDGLVALCILAFWFFVDIGFRVGMTLLMLKMDRKDGVKRTFYPAIELVVVDRNASGRSIRIIAFVVYASLSLICTFVFLVFTWRAHERVDAEIYIPESPVRQNRY